MPPLTQREREVLTLRAYFYQAKEASAHLGITVSTYRHHLQSAGMKMRIQAQLMGGIKAVLAHSLEHLKT